MAGTRRPLSRLRSGSDLRSTPLGTGSGSGAGSGRPAPPPAPPRADAAARPLPRYAGTGSVGGREGRSLPAAGPEARESPLVSYYPVALRPALSFGNLILAIRAAGTTSPLGPSVVDAITVLGFLSEPEETLALQGACADSAAEAEWSHHCPD
ncbi:uncharacterized protein AAEQ78_012698 [Lycaon pictus]